MDETSRAALLSALRTLLGVASGALVAKGLLTADSASQILGAVMSIIPIMWGVIDKYVAERKTQARIADAVLQVAPPVADAATSVPPRP